MKKQPIKIAFSISILLIITSKQTLNLYTCYSFPFICTSYSI